MSQDSDGGRVGSGLRKAVHGAASESGLRGPSEETTLSTQAPTAAGIQPAFPGLEAPWCSAVSFPLLFHA